VKFVRRSRGLFITLVLLIGAEAGLIAAHQSLQFQGFSTGVSIATALVGICVFVLLKRVLLQSRKPETLEICRRGLLITQPETVPFALAWRMIREASFEPGTPQQWRFRLKSGGETILQEGDFSREQWKRFSAQLERKLRTRKIPVRVSATQES
jgi:hypothetical protein